MNKEQEMLKRCPFCGSMPDCNNAYAWCWGTNDHPHAMVQVERAAWNRRSSDEQAEVVGWVDWHGGECPVAPDATVEAKLRHGGPTHVARASGLSWKHGNIHGPTMDSDIVSYRVLASPPAVAAGGVTEERIEAGAKALCLATGLDWDSIPETAEGDDKDTGPETRRYFRQWFKPALTAALAVGDEGMWEGWRPIETAPKDGTRILGSNVKGVSIMQWVDADPPTPDNPGLDAGWLSIDDGGAIPACPGFGTPEEMQPAHWMPIPTPPTTHGP